MPYVVGDDGGRGRERTTEQQGGDDPHSGGILQRLIGRSELLTPFVFIASTDAERAACLRLRREVFIAEQGVSEQDELDELDDACVHFLALPGRGASLKEAYGTARLWPRPGGIAKAQRVAVSLHARGQGVGRALMLALEDEARRRGFRELQLGAQLSALPFYLALAYEPYGEVFDDAGIPHRMVRKPLSRG